MLTATETRAMSRKAMLRACGMTEDQCNAARASAGLPPMAPIAEPVAAKGKATKPPVAAGAPEVDTRALSKASMLREIAKSGGKAPDAEATLIRTARR